LSYVKRGRSPATIHRPRTRFTEKQVADVRLVGGFRVLEYG
jgi:hypothetical protein